MKLAKIAFVISVIALLGIGCAKTPTPMTNTNIPTPVGSSASKIASGTLTIKIMPDNTFEPTTAYVKVGTTITFLNDSDKPHGVISKSTPTDEGLSDFDSNGAFGPNESYTYTFDKVGRWLFHDTTNSAFGGAVVVSE